MFAFRRRPFRPLPTLAQRNLAIWGGGGGGGRGGGQRISKRKGGKHKPAKRKGDEHLYKQAKRKLFSAASESKHEATADEDSDDDYHGRLHTSRMDSHGPWFCSDRSYMLFGASALRTSSDTSEVNYKSDHQPARYRPASFGPAWRTFAEPEDSSSSAVSSSEHGELEGTSFTRPSPMGCDWPVVRAASFPGRAWALPTSSDMSEVKYKGDHQSAYGPASYVSALYRPSAASKDIKYNEKPRYKIMEAAALIGVRPRLEGKEETKRTVSDVASTPSVLSPQQPVRYLDNYRSEGIFDHRGGELAIPSQGLTLFIPRGALPKDTSKKITIEVLRDVPTNIVLRDDEMIVTKGFQCHPSGLYFQVGKPARLRIVHCANVIDSKKIQTVLYSWSHDEQDGNGKVKVERIVQTSSCRATRYTIEISLEHFSGGILAFIWNWWYRNGKLMSFMPFLPRAMPSSRRVMMELRMVNKPHVTYWKNIHVLDKNGHYQAAKDDDDEMTVKQEDLQVELQLERESPLSQSVSPKQLRKTKHTVYFDLNLSGKPDDSLVVLNLKQGPDHLNIKFRTRFCEHPTEPENSSSATSSSEHGELESTSVKRPSEDASDNEVSMRDLEKLIDELGDHEDVGNLALKLGFTHMKWQAFWRMNRDGSFDGTRCMLYNWKKKTLKQEQRSTLTKALEEAHFAQAVEIVQGRHYC